MVNGSYIGIKFEIKVNFQPSEDTFCFISSVFVFCRLILTWLEGFRRRWTRGIRFSITSLALYRRYSILRRISRWQRKLSMIRWVLLRYVRTCQSEFWYQCTSLLDTSVSHNFWQGWGRPKKISPKFNSSHTLEIRLIIGGKLYR